MSKSRAPLYLGLALAGGVGYYLYTAGGDPKLAQKQFESRLLLPFSYVASCLTEVGDAARASQKVREELPGKGREVKKDFEAKAEETRGKFDAAVCLIVL